MPVTLHIGGVGVDAANKPRNKLERGSGVDGVDGSVSVYVAFESGESGNGQGAHDANQHYNH